MIALAIQCPSCGLQLRHGQELLARVQGRRGATRCPRCRDRVHFDATGSTLEVSFPDLYVGSLLDPSATIGDETNPPEVVSDRAVTITAETVLPPMTDEGPEEQSVEVGPPRLVKERFRGPLSETQTPRPRISSRPLLEVDFPVREPGSSTTFRSTSEPEQGDAENRESRIVRRRSSVLHPEIPSDSLDAASVPEDLFGDGEEPVFPLTHLKGVRRGTGTR